MSSVRTVSDAKDAEKKENGTARDHPLSIKESMGRPIGIMSAPERGPLSSSLSECKGEMCSSSLATRGLPAAECPSIHIAFPRRSLTGLTLTPVHRLRFRVRDR